MKTREITIDDWVEFYRQSGPVILLDSQMNNHPSSKKSYLAAGSEASLTFLNDEILWTERNKKQVLHGNPWSYLQKFQASFDDWIFGYLGYDLKNHIEDLKSQNKSLNKAPDLFFMIPAVIIEIDKPGGYRFLKGEQPDLKDFRKKKKSHYSVLNHQSISREKYVGKVKQAQSEIAEGEYYEINLSHPLEFSFRGDAFSLYKKMREYGPVPFGAFIQANDISICCASPERFIARTGQKVWSQPIKGTSVRNGESDYSMKEELHRSVKNRAENLMIVDLVRNDLNRIAIPGSVEVKNLFEIQSFETVHQMVSTVECKVAETANPVEIIKACFPMGSMTGAPKISAMQAIERLEDYKRGIYSGAIGYIKPDGDFDLNVVIRTAIIQSGRLSYSTGGAITSDSVPEQEWEETLWKSKALLNVID